MHPLDPSQITEKTNTVLLRMSARVCNPHMGRREGVDGEMENHQKSSVMTG